jgi:hypothetical protein
MNEKPPGTRPYEVIAYASLAVVFLIQFLEGSPLGGMFAFACGVLAMLGKLQMGPIFYLILIAGAQLSQHNQGIGPRNVFRPAFLEISDVVTCLGVVAFVAAHYRLQGIWFHHLARDPRRRRLEQVPIKSFRLVLSRAAEIPDPQQRRASEKITQAEVSWLILTLPVWVLLAQLLTVLIARVRVPSVDAWLLRILFVGWLLGVGSFVAFHLLDMWKRRVMDPAAARLFLQDTVWRETRGEQRQLQRWLAWKRLNGRLLN